MLAFIVLALLPMQEPAPPESAPVAPPAPVESPPAEGAPAESAPAVDAPAVDAPAAPSEVAPAGDECLALLKDGKRDEAQQCYAARATRDAASESEAALARELADVVGALELRPPTLDVEPAAPDGLQINELLVSGKGELIAVSTLIGGYMATTATVTAGMVVCGSGLCNGPIVAVALLAPVVGGVGGLAVSTATLLAVNPSTGDVNTVRSIMLLGTFDSVMVAAHTAALGGFGGGSSTAALMSFGMFAVQGIGVGAGIGTAALTDLPEGAGSFAISSGLWTTVLSVLGANAFGLTKGRSPNDLALLVTGAGNIGFVGGMIGAQWLPMTRAETWALDIGGGVGLLAGASLATFAHAPNPFIGYGTMAAGTVIGMGAGFAAARYLPPLMGGLPEIVAFAPLTVDDEGAPDAERAVRGAMVMGRF